MISEKYNKFKHKWWGKPIDFDGRFGNQCVDVYRQYCKELGFPQSPPVKGAKDIWNTYLQSCFTKYVNHIWAKPQAGDVLIWDGTYGHVAICDNSTIPTLLSFRAFGQNWFEGGTKKDGKGVCVVTQHNYLRPKLIGWLRPKI